MAGEQAVVVWMRRWLLCRGSTVRLLLLTFGVRSYSTGSISPWLGNRNKTVLACQFSRNLNDIAKLALSVSRAEQPDN